MSDKLFELTQEDAQLMLAAQVHLGSKNVQVSLDEDAKQGEDSTVEIWSLL